MFVYTKTLPFQVDIYTHQYTYLRVRLVFLVLGKKKKRGKITKRT